MNIGFVLKDIETGETVDYCPADFARLLAVARAAAWFVEVTPEKDLYYALNKYCVEAVDDMIAALATVEDLLSEEV